MNGLDILFGTPAALRLVRWFTMNPEAVFPKEDIAKKAKVPLSIATDELALLIRSGVIRKKFVSIEEERVVRDKKRTVSKRVIGFYLNPQFLYLAALTRFMRETIDAEIPGITARLRRVGGVRLIVLGGVFAGSENGIDLLMVGARMREARLVPVIRDIEARVGRDIRYALFDAPTFRYRMSVRDRLIRDVLDYPHQVVLDRLGALL